MSKLDISPVNNEETKTSKKVVLELDKKFEGNNEEVAERLKELRINFMSLFKEQDLLVKQYKKNCDIELKRVGGKRKKKIEGGETKRSGFTKPTKVPIKISEFLGLPVDSVLPRTEVTKHIYEYIKSNDLQVKEDKKKSCTDKKLSELFNLPEKSIIEFSTFQVLLSSVYKLEKARLEGVEFSTSVVEPLVVEQEVVEPEVVELKVETVETTKTLKSKKK